MRKAPILLSLIIFGILGIVTAVKAETMYFDELRVSPSPFVAPPAIPDLVLFAAESQPFLGPGVWDTAEAYAQVDLWDGFDNVFAPQWSIDAAADHISTLINPFQALTWDYWEDSVDIQYIVSEFTPPTEVPLPPAAWLFLSALAGLFVARRKSA